LTELLASLNYAQQPDLAKRIGAVYTFIFRALVTAQVRRDEQSLSDAVRLLEIERDTWRQVVQTNSAGTPTSHALHAPHAVPAPARIDDLPTSRLSFEA
jgi:flagellin-specific chaperone FliS